MNVYFETSSLVKLFLEEPGAEEARDLWDEADLVTVALFSYPEARSALASAQRARRISGVELEDVKRKLSRLWNQTQVVDFDEAVAVSAGDAAESFGLRGYDAVHLATALTLQDDSLLVATWDGDLREAALNAGFRVAPP
ncbi:MAG: type II toxin-antitoxin system VapC family toxin [Actinomycetota bacterium]|nr:type II toxin-antitoxin system VapC family toxin [Actinomycetota bacterium]